MKAVLVIDMPADCPECPMAHWNKLDEFTGCEAVSGKKYAINDKEYAESSCRPSWCPLRPIPKPRINEYMKYEYLTIPTDKTEGIAYRMGLRTGWLGCLSELGVDDACLKEITGETE